MKSSSSRNIAYNVLGQGAQLVLSLVAVKLVFARLGEDAVGIIYFSLTLNAVVGAILDMGIGATTTREVASHLDQEPRYIRDLIRTTSLFYWCGYVLLGAAIWLTAPYLVEKWLILESLDAATAIQAVRILGVGALLGLPRSLYVGLFRGLQRMEFNNLIDVAVAGLQQLGIIAVLLLGGGLLPAVSCLAFGYALGLVIYVLAAARFVPWTAFVPGYSSAVVGRNWRFSLGMASISVLATVHTQSDKVILSRLLPLRTLGWYSVMYGLFAKASMVTGAVSQAVFPVLSSQASAGDRDLLTSTYRKFQDLVCYATIPVFAAATFAALPLFTFVFSAEVARTLLAPAVLLAVGFFMNSALTLPYILSLAVGRPEIMARTNLLALFVVLPATGLLIYYGGVLGASSSWVVYHLFAYSVALPRICRECLDLPLAAWLRSFSRAVGLACVTYGAAWAVVMVVGAGTPLPLALAYVLASTAFLAGAYRLVDRATAAAIDARVAGLAARLPARMFHSTDDP